MRLFFCVAGLLQIVAAFAQPQPPRPTPYVVQATAPIKCVDVIDGDTIILSDQTTVRLIGVDTPEIVDPRKPVQLFGKESTDFVRKLAEGKDMRLEYGPERTDKYGRTLAFVYLPDGRMLNGEIVRRGYGFAYTKFPFKYMEIFKECEREARLKQLGLWNPSVQALIPGSAVAETKQMPAATPALPELFRSPDAPVYVTPNGKKYHRESCSTLGRKTEAIDKAQALSRGLAPCSVCAP